MTGESWNRVQEIFHAVSDIAEPGVRGAEVLRLAEGDAEIQREVERMLAFDGAESVLDANGPAGFASEATSQRQIGPYVVERVLGEGGMGTVFLARRPDLDVPAAIKVLRDAWISPARRRLFALEERTLARLDHPNIARLLDANTLDDGTPYFVMEYVDGEPLDAGYCERAGHRIRARLQLFRAVCEAVQFAHGQAVIHRDLKPSNILVRPDGTVKLLDFGIAKHMAAGGNPDMTRTGLRLLTPAYASPEQVRGEPASVQMDVYSLGVILHLLLSGRLPSEEEELKPSMIVRRSGVALLEATESEWADLDVLCLTAMHKDVQKRYGSVEALLRDIDHYLRAEPLEARPDSWGYRAGKFLQRNRSAVIGAGAAVVAVSALIAFFVFRLAQERNTALAEAARTQRIQVFMRNLFQGGDAEAGPANDLRVETLIDRGVQEARTLDKDPAAQAELYQTLGDIYHKLGKLEQAEAMLTAALEMRRSPDNVVALAMLRTDQAKIEEAERMAREGLQLARTSLPAGHPTIAAATDALGKVLEEKGDYDGAIRELSEAVRLRSTVAGGDTAELASSLYELGNAYFYAGRYKECEEINQRVLAMVRRIYGERHPRVSEALTNLGAIQQDQGNYKEAERYHREALALVRAFYGDKHYRTAASLTMVGRALVFQKRAPEAEAVLRQALEIQEQVFGPEHPRVASALNELGTVHLTQDRPAEARPHYVRMAAIYKAVYSGKHYLIGTALSNIGSTYMAEKDYATAEPYFRDAVAVFRETQGPDHINLGIAQIKLGRTLLRQNKIAEAERSTSAGYAIVQKQVNPSASWLNSARADLEAIRKLK